MSRDDCGNYDIRTEIKEAVNSIEKNEEKRMGEQPKIKRSALLLEAARAERDWLKVYLIYSKFIFKHCFFFIKENIVFMHMYLGPKCI